MSKALVVVGRNPLIRQAGGGLVEFDEKVRALLEELAPRGGGLNLPPGFVGAVEEITKHLAPFLPWLAIPLALIPGTKNLLARRRFKKLFSQALIHVLNPDTAFNKLNDLRAIIALGKLADIEVSVELADEVLQLVPMLLQHPSIQAQFEERGLARYLMFVKRRFRIARLEPPDSHDQNVQIAVARTLSAMVRMQDSNTPKQLGSLLESIGHVCIAHLDETRGAVDVNLMVPLKDKGAARSDCMKNLNARKAFGEALYDRAEIILQVHTTTNPTYDGFWLPVFTEVSARMPGATAAYRTQTPQVLFCRHVGQDPFGESHTEEDIDRILTYLSQVPFNVVLSLPVLKNGAAIGVININIGEDEVMLYSRSELLRLYHTFMPYLAAIEVTLESLEPAL
jgi:hypothetical protein